MSKRHLPKYRELGFTTSWAFKQEVKRRIDLGQTQELIAVELKCTPQYISKVAKELRRRFRHVDEPDSDPARQETSPSEVRDTPEPEPQLDRPETPAG